ncbi:MAG: DUF1003 domain-containing protein [bacterium]|nr:DUF1003 domain-containing protein [bacterium]
MFTIFGRGVRKAETKLAEALTRFAGSMFFVYVHVIWFAVWIIFSKQIGDSFPYGLLTMVVSLEAIFLATFIMVTQNRHEEMAAAKAKEDEEQEEEIEEELEDIQEDFDSLRGDLDEMKSLIERLESHLAQRGNVPLNLPNASKVKTIPTKPEIEKEKVAV